jgi:hypothetical protein
MKKKELQSDITNWIKNSTKIEIFKKHKSNSDNGIYSNFYKQSKLRPPFIIPIRIGIKKHQLFNSFFIGIII